MFFFFVCYIAELNTRSRVCPHRPYLLTWSLSLIIINKHDNTSGVFYPPPLKERKHWRGKDRYEWRKRMRVHLRLLKLWWNAGVMSTVCPWVISFCREPKNWGRLLITLAVWLLKPVNITPEWWWIPPELRLLSCYCFKKVCTLQSEPTWVKCALHMSKGSRHCFIVFYIVACCVLFAWVCVVLHGFPCRRPVCVCTSCHCLMSVLPMTSLDFLITCTW